MKLFSYIFLFNIIFLTSFYTASETLKITHLSNNTKLSVWDIYNNNSPGYGTAFFINNKIAATTFHNALSLLRNQNDIQNLALSQPQEGKNLKIKRIISLSAFYDIALFEIEEEVEHYLTLSETSPQLGDDLLFIAYLDEHFRKIKKTGQILYQHSDQSYTFPVDHSNLSGTNGGPVLNNQEHVVGMAYGASANFLNVIKLSYLKKVIKENEGTNCLNFSNQKNCIQKEIENIHILAKQGHPFAQESLGSMYYHSRGVKKNDKLAFLWWKKAADQNYPPAQHNLSSMYATGTGINKNVELALSSLNEAANTGYAPSQLDLAYKYSSGNDEDLKLALHWSILAAQQNYVNAQYHVGRIYHFGKGVKKDAKLAFDWMFKAAIQGHTEAQFNVASSFYSGKGVEKKDYFLAFDWMSKAAVRGYADAQNILAKFHYHGVGVNKNFETAIFWWTKAAEQGHDEATQALFSVLDME